MGKVKNAKTKIVATVKVKATGEIAKKIAVVNATNAGDQVKQVQLSGERADGTKWDATILWATIEIVAQGQKIVARLSDATRSNGQERRNWCNDNSAKMVDVSAIANKIGSGRPENTLRAKLLVLAKTSAAAKKIGYVRVLDTATALAPWTDPKTKIVHKTHPLREMVYIYRQK